MRDSLRSPSEYYIRFLISGQEDQDEINANEVYDLLNNLGLDGISTGYIRSVAAAMPNRPNGYCPHDKSNYPTREWLKTLKIFDMWHPTPGVREAQLILADPFLREKLEPLLLSTLSHGALARKLRKYTSIALTSEGVSAYGHYFWNRRLLSQQQWVEYLRGVTHCNPYIQGLLTSKDLAPKHLPWVVGISGPGDEFNSAEAASRIGQIAFKHALELEHRPASVDTTMALKNCMTTIEKSDMIMRRSDVALRDVLKQFQKFRMNLDEAKVIDVKQLTGGNYSKSGEGTDVSDDEDF